MSKYRATKLLIDGDFFDFGSGLNATRFHGSTRDADRKSKRCPTLGLLPATAMAVALLRFRIVLIPRESGKLSRRFYRHFHYKRKVVSSSLQS